MSERDRPTYEPEGAGDYLWLRYATHFSVGAREYTIEMGVPMPIGASYEEREQLLREADAGMNQLSGHVEEKVARMLQRIQPNQGPLPTPTPSVRSSNSTSAPSVAATPANSQRQTTRPASIPAEQTGPQPAYPTSPDRSRDVRENRSPAAEQRPPTQQDTNGSASRPPNTGTPLMPMAAIDELTGNVSLPQFITVVRDTMGLNPKQAMEMLRVKSLTTINLREALEKLRAMMEPSGTEETPKSNTGAASINTNTAGNQRPRESGAGEGRAPTGKSNPPSSPVNTPNRPDARPSLNIPGLTVGTGSIKSNPKPVRRDEETDVREGRPVYTFDEEEDDELEDLLEDEEEEENELSPQALAQARALVNQFRESRGPTVANAARLQVLSNVLDGQIDEDQLLDLIEGIWSVNNSRKLKVDQVELLISWAKTDEFLEEVNAVLTVLEEEM